jgi:hypothetical protein
MRFVRSLLLPLALLVLGAGIANAHDGYTHEANEQAQSALSSTGAALGSSCPGGPDKLCCCGTVAALGTSGKLTALPARWNVGPQRPGAAPLVTIRTAPRAVPLFAAARPRAPPELS